jgi:type I restriction enzyme R subunit
MTTPSFKEEHLAQIPAIQMLMKLGYQYLSPEMAIEARGRRSANVLLESILKTQLQKINTIEYRGKEYPFSEANLNAAILALRDLPLQDGFMAANKAAYELLTLGKSFEQSILGDKKSFSLNYIDWKNPDNNVFHVCEEYTVLRQGRNDTYRPDLVLFVNGIPLVIIECKSPSLQHRDTKSPVDLAIEQHLRNQQEDGIRNLYHYSSLLLSLAVNDARYATTATTKEFWAVWKAQFVSEQEAQTSAQELHQLKNALLPIADSSLLFEQRFYSVLAYFKQLEQNERVVTEQDLLLYNLCRKDRLLELIYHYTLYDEGVKKISRYQQYFAVKRSLERIAQIQPDGRRLGGVIWHTQGSGKSLTMVMLAQLIAMHPAIKNPRIILVSDRVDLDDQITETFKKCEKPVHNATTGENLVKLLEQNKDAIITTIINKFQSAVQKSHESFDSPNVFVLVDESHRTQYGTFNVKMQKMFPRACYIAFTGTPLLKKDRSTAAKFGGLIPGTVYTIGHAVADKAVVPLLYEGRHNVLQVNERALDMGFSRVAEDLPEFAQADLKRNFSTRNTIVQSSSFVENTAWDISKHFTENIQHTGFKGQLVAPNKKTGLRYYEELREIGKVSVALLISAPDMREGEEDAFEESKDEIKNFWKAMLGKYGSAEKYEETLIKSFKKQDSPEIIIVVDKLLTGFDAPRNQVLYLTRNLREHTLLQAIARVNRLYPGKDYGLIIDYYGNLENLDDALHTYAGLEGYDSAELEGSLINVKSEVEKLPQAHAELWDLFKTIRNKYDEPAYEELLNDEAQRHIFYERLSLFLRLLKLALSTVEFEQQTPPALIEHYKSDAKFFLGLRVSVKRRYFDSLDYSAYEAQVQKLIDKHITTEGDVLRITELVDIFNKEEREAEIEKITGRAARADHIASRSIKAISVKMNEDPVFYKRLSQLIRQAIDDYHQQRISEAEFLSRVQQYEDAVFNGVQHNIPTAIRENAVAISFYNLINEAFKPSLEQKAEKVEIAATLALAIDAEIRAQVFDEGRPVIDWQANEDIKGRIRIAVDDLIFEFKSQHNLDISIEQIDNLLEESLQVAALKY